MLKAKASLIVFLTCWIVILSYQPITENRYVTLTYNAFLAVISFYCINFALNSELRANKLLRHVIAAASSAGLIIAFGSLFIGKPSIYEKWASLGSGTMYLEGKVAIFGDLTHLTSAAKCDYPLHLGVTEAGPIFQGTIKSATAFGILLAEGIGDTIRVSLSAPPVEEVKVGISILESLNLRQRKLEIVSCPSCGRAQVDVYTLAEKVQAGLQGMTVPLRVAVMGCVVNGPGEAREADLGVASGNGKGQIFVKGEVIKTVPEAQIVETLIEEAMRLAEEMEAAGVASGKPSVAVS